MTRWIHPLCAVTLMVAACGKKQEATKSDEPAAAIPAPPADSASSAQPAPPEPPPAVVAGAEPTTEIDADEVPTEEDFEEEAERKITAANLEAALDELEREIVD